MSYGIVRVAKVKAANVRGLLRHHNRDEQPPNADPSARPTNVALVGGDTAAAMLTLGQAKASAIAAGQRWRTDQVAALDLFVGASPEWFRAGPGRDIEVQDAYFARALAWIRERYGAANVLTAQLHRDETSPHLQVVVMPRDERGHFCAKRIVGQAKDLQALQDDFAAKVLEPRYGLQRGERGSKARHVRIKAFYAALDKSPDLPRAVPVPPAPTLRDRLMGRAARMLAARQAALDRNKAVRREIQERAKQAGALHPARLSALAEREREAADALGRAESEAQEAQRLREEARQERVRIESAAARAKSWALSDDAARAVARLTRVLDADAVASISERVGVELVPGRDLIDQLRRAGLAGNLVEGAELLASVVGRITTDTGDALEQIRTIRRDAGGPELDQVDGPAPRPR